MFPQGFQQVQQEIRGLGTLRPAKPETSQIMEFESWKFWISKNLRAVDVFFASCVNEGWGHRKGGENKNACHWFFGSGPFLSLFGEGKMEESNGMECYEVCTCFDIVFVWSCWFVCWFGHIWAMEVSLVTLRKISQAWRRLLFSSTCTVYIYLYNTISLIHIHVLHMLPRSNFYCVSRFEFPCHVWVVEIQL